MCVSLKHGYTHIHTTTHFIHNVQMGVHILVADKVNHSHTVLRTITQTPLLTLLHTCFADLIHLSLNIKKKTDFVNIELVSCLSYANARRPRL